MPRWLSRKIHAIKRAKERNGIELSDKDYDLIGELIRNSCSIPLGKISHTMSFQEIHFCGKVFIALYSHRHKIIITFFPNSLKTHRYISRKTLAFKNRVTIIAGTESQETSPTHLIL